MRRVRIELDEVAAWANLTDAAHKAARGKRQRPEVARFFARFDESLAELGEAIRAGWMPRGALRRFVIHDPKQRTIHVAPFEERVFHHALMNHAGPVLDRALTDAAFACRVGRGQHAAARRVQQHLRRFPWYVQIDIAGYFDTIDHARLLDLLARRFKGDGLMACLGRILDSYHTAPGKGLPIGALTSQHFANFYLDGLDRLLQERMPARALVRYMDDAIWWCDDRRTAHATLDAAREWLANERLLVVKAAPRINRSTHGATFCGFRILPGAVRLTRRKQRRYQGRRLAWEAAFAAGEIDARQLQNAYAAVHAITAHIDSQAWRRENLRRFPPPDL